MAAQGAGAAVGPAPLRPGHRRAAEGPAGLARRAMSGESLLGLAMLLVMMGAIFAGFPVAFTLLALAFAFGSLTLGTRVFDLAFFQTTGLMRDELLAAVPLFVFMGYLVEQAGLMERLFLALRLLLAPVRGSLFIVVVLMATVFVMATGTVGVAMRTI